MKWLCLPLVLFGASLNVTAQMLLKKGMHRIGPLGLEAVGRKLVAVLTSPFIWLGGAALVASLAVWLVIISRVEVSWAYPLTASLSFLAVTLLGWWGLNEAVGALRVAGVLLICAGVAMVVSS